MDVCYLVVAIYAGLTPPVLFYTLHAKSYEKVPGRITRKHGFVSDLAIIIETYRLAKKSKVFAMEKFPIPGTCFFDMVMYFQKHAFHTSLLAFEICIAQANVMCMEFGNPRVK